MVVEESKVERPGSLKAAGEGRKCSAVRLRPKRAAKRVSAPEKYIPGLSITITTDSVLIDSRLQ